jgi:hypothetical protein
MTIFFNLHPFNMYSTVNLVPLITGLPAMILGLVETRFKSSWSDMILRFGEIL